MTNLIFVFDLDGTLVSNTDSASQLPVVRPYLKELLLYLRKKCFRVGLWTAASREWYDLVYSKLLRPIFETINFQFDFTWYGHRCTRIYSKHFGYYTWDPEGIVVIKPLKKFWKAKTLYWYAHQHNMLILDDTESTAQRNYGNLIRAPTFNPMHDDMYFLNLAKHFETNFTPEYDNQLKVLSNITTLSLFCLMIVELYSPLRSVRKMKKTWSSKCVL